MSAPARPDWDRVRGVVFDLDGTLVDSYAAIRESLNHARAAYALPPLDAPTVRRGVGRGLECLVAEFVGPERVADGVRRFRERYAVVYEAHTRPLPGAVDAVRRIHAAGYPLALASNKPARFGAPILEAIGLREAFAAVLGPDVVGSAKPHPAMLRAAARACGVAAPQALYVGDMPLDVESGARAGMPVALVRGGSASEEELLTSAAPVFGDLIELARRLPALSQDRA